MAQPYETIRLEIDAGGVASLVLNRPAKHNALNAVMIRELTDAVGRLAGDDVIRVVIISAAGETFCAGVDLSWMEEQFAAAHPARLAEASRLTLMFRHLDELPKLLIAIIDGPAYGMGVGLAAVSDIVLATPRSEFVLSEIRLGLMPAAIAPYLVRRIGLGALRKYALNATPIGASEARNLSLVSEIHENQHLSGAIDRQVDNALASAPGAIAESKKLFRRIASGAVTQSGIVEALAARWESSEAQQGVAAFFQRSPPPWAE